MTESAPPGKATILLAALALSLVITWLDYWTGYELTIGATYIIPVALTSWYCGGQWGFVFVLLASTGYYVADFAEGHTYSHRFYQTWNAIDHSALLLAFSRVVILVRKRLLESQALNQRLIESLKTVEELRNLLRVCAWCKKIRDDNDHWEPLDVYLEKNTRLSFTHGICPDCQRSLMEARKE